MNHFHFASNAVDPTVDFYETYFGFRRCRTLGKTHVLEGHHGFLLAIDESDTTIAPPAGSHLGFRLRTSEAVGAIFRQMEHAGVTITRPLVSPSPKATHFYCQDPSGHTIEVGWYDL